MKIFLTGGSGFLGASLINRLRADGHHVLALARGDASAERVRALGAEPVHGDLEQLVDATPSWTTALASCDVIVHAASYMEFWGPDRVFRERNLHPTVALHAAAARARVSRFVFVSAAAVSSGSQRAPVVDENSDDGRQLLGYSRIKLATERALLAAPAADTDLVILRPPFIWGAGMTTLDGFVEAINAGQFAWIDGGSHTMDFIHVANLSHAIVRALDHGRPGGVYYITDGHPRPIREFISALLETRGVTPPTRSVPRPIAATLATAMETTFKLTGRTTAPPMTRWLVTFLGRDRSYDITAARRDLRYEPAMTYEDGLAEMRSDA